MDLRQDVTYSEDEVSLNDSAVTAGKAIGTQINSLNISPVSVVGYTEKKALTKGLDASDVYSGQRTVRIVAQTSDKTYGETYDRFQDLLVLLTPDEEFRTDSADDKGYLPLRGSIPTADSSFPESPADSGKYLIPVVIYCRAKNPPQFDLNRDRVGGKADRGFSIPWQVVLEAKDPRVYIDDEQIVAFTGTSGAGTFTNRGKYPTPLSVILEVKANQLASVFELVMGETTMTIDIPNNAATQTFWYDGYRKFLYRKIGAGVYTKAASYLTIDNPAEALPDDLAYSWTLTHDALAALGSVITYFEAWG